MSVIGSEYDYYHKTCTRIGLGEQKQTNII